MKHPGRLITAAAAALLVATSLLVSTLLISPLPLLPLLPCLPVVSSHSPLGRRVRAVRPRRTCRCRRVLRYHGDRAAAIACRDLALPRRALPPRADTVAGVRPRPRLAALARAQPRRHHRLPGGGPEVVPHYRVVRSQSPHLRAHLVSYRTRLDQADRLFESYKQFPSCVPGASADSVVPVRANAACPLALHDLPPEVYEIEWDMLMVDAPKGYFASAPGRMAAIWTAAAMARARSGEGATDVFLHDVDRKVEKMHGEEFLCDRFRIGGTGRLWHFRIPPVSRRGNSTTTAGGGERPFC